MRLLRFITLACVLGWSIGAGATDRLTLRSNPFNEVLREAAQISGVVVAGVLRHGASGQPGNGVLLSADLPPRWAGREVCARVLSADGLYEAANEYSLPKNWAGGVAELPFPTAYADLLVSFGPTALAIQISEGNCATASADTAVALWNLKPDTHAPSILVNSFRADEVFVYLGDDPAAIRCEALPIQGMSAFDHACTLPEDAEGEVEITLYRISNGKPATPSVTRLWLGNGA